MNDLEKAKLNQFANDKAMNETVFGVFENIFVKKSKDRDVQNLASRFLALELLEEARAEFEKYKVSSNEEDKVSNNIGL